MTLLDHFISRASKVVDEYNSLRESAGHRASVSRSCDMFWLNVETKTIANGQLFSVLELSMIGIQLEEFIRTTLDRMTYEIRESPNDTIHVRRCLR